MDFHGAVESSRAMVGASFQMPSQSPRTRRTKSCSIHVTVQGSDGAQRSGRCKKIHSWSLLVPDVVVSFSFQNPAVLRKYPLVEKTSGNNLEEKSGVEPLKAV